MSALLVSIHDVAPATLPEARRWLDEMDERGLPATLLVVPGPWRRPTLVEDEATRVWLRAAVKRGHEVALHGWDHGPCSGARPSRRAVGRLVARGTDEFIDLDRPRASGRLAAGQRLLAEEGLPVEGFHPPGWLASRATVQAAGEIGLRYLSSHRAVLDLRRARRHPLPAFSNRPGGWGEGLGADGLRHLAPRLARRGGVRIALHPDDLRHARTRSAALDAIDACRRVAPATTYLDLVRGHLPVGAAA